MEKRYSTDLSDTEWSYLEPYLPAPKQRGRPRVHSYREILNAVFYLLKTGCQWRMLPREFPPWKTVFHYFRQWRLDGTWEKINRAIREQLRVRIGRNPEPSAGIVDAQSAKTTGVGGEDVAMMVARRSMAESVRCWWIQRAWWSRRRYTALRSPTRTD